ncbi:MAG: Crp/Fnr family transcriptional regulator [Bacillota bacterium]
MGLGNIPWIVPSCYNWREIAQKKGVSKEYPAGCTILNQGDVVQNLYYVDKGLARFVIVDAGGKARAPGILFPGSVFGDGPLFLGEPLTINVQAIETSLIYNISKETAYRAINDNPQLAVDIICNVTLKFKSAIKSLGSQSIFNPKERLVYFWYSLLKYNQSELMEEYNKIPVNLSHQQLGEFIGTNRVTVCRIINSLKKIGCVRVVNNEIYVSSELLKEYVDLFEY